MDRSRWNLLAPIGSLWAEKQALLENEERFFKMLDPYPSDATLRIEHEEKVKARRDPAGEG
jgi:hypothetical protein